MMTWIKNHPAQTAVIALSLSLTASSVELYREHASSRGRSAQLGASHPSPAAGFDIDNTRVENALAAARAPGVWPMNTPATGRLFAAKRHVVIGGVVQQPEGKTFRPPVPNDWLLKHGLDPLAPDVLESDPDKDGFTTLQEWEGLDAQSHLDKTGKAVTASGGALLEEDSTNPVDAAIHPPYHTRLVLERVEQIPFHLRFLGHDFDAKNPKKVSVQINAVPGRTEFVEVGKSLAHAPVDVRSFTAKEAPGADGTTKDVSEVVVVDRRTGEEVTLPKGEVVNSPESYAILRYDWAPAQEQASGKAPIRFRLRKNETFRLPPQNQVYRVAEIRLDGVDVVLPSGAKHTVIAAKK